MLIFQLKKFFNSKRSDLVLKTLNIDKNNKVVNVIIYKIVFFGARLSIR